MGFRDNYIGCFVAVRLNIVFGLKILFLSIFASDKKDEDCWYFQLDEKNYYQGVTHQWRSSIKSREC